MGFSYKPLWKLLIDRDMNREEMRKAVGLSSGTLAKMGKNEPVAMDVLDRICRYLECRVEDIVQHVADGE